jgi:hypothetical protein
MEYARLATPSCAAAKVHQAAGIRRHESVRAGGAVQLFICHCHGDLRLTD